MRAIELFCGAGLLGKGFAQAGFEMTFAADLDASAVESYNKNQKHKVAKVQDVGVIKRGLICDIIIAGPPCQGFSSLGKRDRLDARNKLSLVLPNWAKVNKAKVVVIENVPQFLNSQYHKVLVRNFEDLGFDHVSWVLNASDYGVPQHRRRSFTIFSKIGLPKPPKPCSKNVTVKDAFRGLGPATGKDDPLHYSAKVPAIARERIKRIPRNGDKFDLMKIAPELCPKSWFLMGRQAVDVWGRMKANEPSNTIRCCFWNPSKGRYIHPTENRVITLREGARLQGIPDHWQFFGSKSTIARHIGNGVPIPLAKAVAQSIRTLF